MSLFHILVILKAEESRGTGKFVSHEVDILWKLVKNVYAKHRTIFLNAPLNNGILEENNGIGLQFTQHR